MSPLDTLNPASFRGVAFHVESDKDGQGREADVKLFPLRDGARVRDMGLGKREITVEAYLSSLHGSAGAAEAFRAGMLAPGLGPLILPNAIIAKALCTKCERDFKRDKIGRIGFSLAFVADDESFSLPSLGAIGMLIGGLASVLRGVLPDLATRLSSGGAQAEGFQAGLGAMQGAVAQADPGAVVLPTMSSLGDHASALALRAGPGDSAVAEKIARG